MGKNINPAFGSRVKELRESAGLTQDGLADKSGVPRGTIREVEQGRREPLFGVMQKIAAALGCSLDGLPVTTIVEQPAPPLVRKAGGKKAQQKQ